MNNRIEELAEQAAYATRNQHNNPYWRMQDEIPEDATWRQRFAELIAGECNELINKEINRLCEYQKSLPEWDENRREDCDLVIEKCLDISESIKQHFEGKN